MGRASRARRGRADAPAPAKPAPSGAEPLSAGRRAAFTGAMLLLPVAFFLLLEGGLRVFGYGAEYPLFEPVDGFPGLLVQNREVARRYFVHQQNVPNANADYFASTKAAGALRVVALGESSTAGFPFYWGAAFPRVLGNRLRAAFPDREVEVINTAMAAINSYTLLDLADEVIAIRPDAVVIYAGHNEYYGALGAASSESLGRRPGVVRAFLSLRRFRTVQLLRNAVAAVQRASAGAERGRRPDGTLMARMIGEQRVPVGSDTYEAGRRQFAENMDLLLARLRDAGVPTFVGTLASNERDQRPFVTVSSADSVAWRAEIAAGAAAEARGDSAAALAAYGRAVALDPGAAEGHFLNGRALLAAGRAEEARTAFLRAKDLDALRFRAPEVFNEDLRAAARRRGATVVDVQAALRAASPDGIIGRETMMEHLHPNLDGYTRIADAFFAAMAPRLGGRPEPTTGGEAYRVVSPIDSVVGYLRLEQLTRTWPFRPGEEQPFREGAEPALLELARAYYEDRTSWQEANFRLAAFYEGAGRLERALLVRQALVQAYPFVGQHLVALGSLQMRIAQERGRPATFADAEQTFRGARARDPREASAASMLGALLLNRGAAAEAVPHLEAATRLAPRDVQALYNLAGAYALTGRVPEARRSAGQVLALQPGHAGATALLGSLGG